MAQQKSSNMALKVIIAIVVIVVLVYLFKGMGSSPANPTTPSTTPGTQPGQAPATTPGTTAGQNMTEPIKPATTTAEAVSTTGLTLVTNILCDYTNKVVTFTLTDTMDKKLKIYQGELNALNPETPTENIVKLGVNGRWPNPRENRDVDCGGKFTLDPKESVTCSMKNVVLRDAAQVDKITGMKGQNVFTATNMNNAYKNYNDLDYFTCK